MNHQKNQLAPPSTTVVHTPKPLGQRAKPFVVIGGLALSIAYGYKKGGYVGSAVGAILYYIIAKKILLHQAGAYS